MAPTQPKPKLARPSHRTRPSYPTPTPTFASTKKDKRTIKHSALLSRIEKAAPKRRPRRRPSKSLVTTLTSLADALPAVEAGKTGTGGMGSGKKSLKTRPGAMKRKRNLETMERERFEMNMAQMAGMREEYSESVQGREIVRVVGDEGGDGAGTGIGVGEAGPGTGTGTVGTAERWAALRGFIQQTLETRPGMKTA